MKGRKIIPKDIKLGIINLVEASPMKKSWVLGRIGMPAIKYYRWQHKYYLDNTLEDRRGRHKRLRPRLEDLYRCHIINHREIKMLGTTLIGPERIASELEQEGIYLSHETIRKVLHQEGLIEPQVRTLKHEYKRFEAETVHAMWQIDILYLMVRGYGYYYLYSILDDYSRMIVSWHLSDRATVGEAIETVEQAMAQCKAKPISILTDRGIQFYSGEGKTLGKFEQFLLGQDINHILARVRHPQTLGKIERYHRSLRQEWLNHHQYCDPQEARRSIREYLEHYNYIRKHKGIGRVTPFQRYTGQDIAILQQREILRAEFRKNPLAYKLSDRHIENELATQETIQTLKKLVHKEVFFA